MGAELATSSTMNFALCHIPLKIELQKMTALKILVYAITDEHEGAEGRGEYFLHGPKLALI